MKSKKVLVILGPTATGKTDLAIRLTKKFNGELVSCDSRQIYKGLDIGSGKYVDNKTTIQKENGYWIIAGIKVWMFDVVDLSVQYNVSDYVKDTNKVIENIFKSGKLPIIVGGTGLYLKVLLEGLTNLSILVDEKLRDELSKLSLRELQLRLQKVAPERWEALNYSDRQNPRRLLRSIELVSMNPYIDKQEINSNYQKYDSLKIGLTAPREILYKRVDFNISKRLKGMQQEVKELLEHGIAVERLKSLGLEYGVLADYMKGAVKETDLERVLQGKIHGYVRRQLTWFKGEKDVFWFDITSKTYLEEVEKLVLKWYHSANAKEN